VSSVVDARAMDESMRAVCERIVSRLECDLCWMIRVVGRTVSTRRLRGQARDGSTRVVTGTTSTRDPVKPSSVRRESLTCEIIDGSRDSRVARAERQNGGSISAHATATCARRCCQPIDRWKEDIRTVYLDTDFRFSPFSFLQGHSRCHLVRGTWTRDDACCDERSVLLCLREHETLSPGLSLSALGVRAVTLTSRGTLIVCIPPLYSTERVDAPTCADRSIGHARAGPATVPLVIRLRLALCPGSGFIK